MIISIDEENTFDKLYIFVKKENQKPPNKW